MKYRRIVKKGKQSMVLYHEIPNKEFTLEYGKVKTSMITEGDSI